MKNLKATNLKTQTTQTTQTMEKIIKAALAAKYPTASVDALLEVVMGTPNPEIATEILLGVYSYPIVNLEPHENCNPSETNKLFINHDKWTDQVNYNYNPRKSKYGWYKKGLSENERYIACLDAYSSSRTEYAEQLGLTEDEFEYQYIKGNCYGPIDTASTRTSYCSINNWNYGK